MIIYTHWIKSHIIHPHWIIIIIEHHVIHHIVHHFLIILFLTLIILPINVFAYSKYLVPGGENLGINIKSNGILIVGFYDAKVKSDLQIGDVIISINDQNVTSIDEMLEFVNPNSNDNISLKIGYKRGGQKYYTNMDLVRDSNGVFKSNERLLFFFQKQYADICTSLMTLQSVLF